MESNPTPKEVIDNFSDDTRIALKDIAAQVKDLKISISGNTGETFDGEIFANLTLCYRHLEDASMRLGKVKQFNNNGESIYDKNVVGSNQN
jgi:hypothetical protein